MFGVFTHSLSLLHYWRVVHLTPLLKGGTLLTFVVLQSAVAVKTKLLCLFSTKAWLAYRHQYTIVHWVLHGRATKTSASVLVGIASGRHPVC
jgi:hypothetical protein